VIRHFYTKDMEASASVVEGIEAALGVYKRLGAEVVDITVPPLQDYSTCNRTILLSEACSIHERWFKERPGDYSKSTRERMLPGLFLSALDYVGATRWRGELTRAMEQAMARVDVVVTASSMEPPYPIDDPVAVEKFYPRQARAPFNLTGQPALGIPIGFTADKLPLGLQIVGRHWDEAMVYRVARAYERETECHKTHPELER
jgi:aspartyl-tRNA(Asn)/glutamyl-tRNA(Gln) amidotransferase subunit A